MPNTILYQDWPIPKILWSVPKKFGHYQKKIWPVPKKKLASTKINFPPVLKKNLHLINLVCFPSSNNNRQHCFVISLNYKKKLNPMFPWFPRRNPSYGNVGICSICLPAGTSSGFYSSFSSSSGLSRNPPQAWPITPPSSPDHCTLYILHWTHDSTRLPAPSSHKW